MEEAGNNTSHFTPKQHEAIALLARGNTQECTAETVGVARQTIATWMKKPEFKSAIELYSQKAIARREKSVDAKMSQLELKALETLEVLMDSAVKEADRINAARAVLAHQNSRRHESNNGVLVNFGGLHFLGSPSMNDTVEGDVANADD